MPLMAGELPKKRRSGHKSKTPPLLRTRSSGFRCRGGSRCLLETGWGRWEARGQLEKETLAYGAFRLIEVGF
jgi:hypothetical protein